MTHGSRHTSPRRIAAAFGLLAFVAACDGPNQFKGSPVDPEPVPGDPPIVEIQAPTPGAMDQKLVGDSVLVRVRAADDVGVDSITFEGIAKRGDADLGTDEVVTRFVEKSVPALGSQDTTVVRYLLPTADESVETGYIVAKVYDSEGMFTADTVAIALVESAIPTVSITAPATSPVEVIAIGDSVRVSVDAADDIGVDSVRLSGIAIRGDASLGTEEIVERFNGQLLTFGSAVTDTTVTRYLRSTADVTRETAYIIAEAFDADLQVGADTVAITVGGSMPMVDIQTPAASPMLDVLLGDSVSMTVRATDDFGLVGLRMFGIALRGDPNLGTQEVIARFAEKSIPLVGTADTTVTRYLLPELSLTEEVVYLVAEATDVDGFIMTDTVAINMVAPPVVPPLVEIELPRGDSLSAKPLGDSVFVRARALDNLGIDSVRFSGVAFRGDKDLGTDEVVQRFFPKTVPGLGAVDTTVTRYLLATADTTRETAFIIAEAFDNEGLMAADTVPLVLGGPDVQLQNVAEGQSIQAGLNLNLGVIARDPQGVIRLEIELTGALDTTFVSDVVPAADSVALDTIIAIPETALGILNVSARARNALDVTGQDGPIQMFILPADAGDTIRPTVNMSVETLPRYELTDSLFVNVFGRDDTQGSGIIRAGITTRAISQSSNDTVTTIQEQMFDPLTGTVSRRLGFQTFNVDPLSLPDTVVYEITGYMVDANGNCSASDSDTGDSFTCQLVGDTVYAEGRPGFRTVAGHVSGRTINLPAGGAIGDAVVDTVRRNLFLSNPSRGVVEVFRLGTQEFDEPIRAGSLPWGLAMSRDGDSLWVANSGATNLSVIDLTTERESNANRFFTPDVVLFDIQVEESDAGTRFLTFFFPQAGDPSFTDQPQFIAVDAFGNPVYSTVVNGTGTLGTARKAFFPVGGDASEVKLFTEHGGTSPTQDFWAVANVDNVTVTNVVNTETDSLGNTIETLESTLTIFDHVPGFPDQIITGSADLTQAELPGVAAARLANEGSDVTIYDAARWDIESLGFGDTTYVAASGDGRWVAIGEGAREPASRVLMYEAAQLDTTRLSGVIPVTDFLTNTSERVRGVGVNYDGSLVVARGDQAYFFSEDLRKQGQTPIASPELGAGAAFHPLHANVPSQNNATGAYNPNTHLAFVGSGERTIDVIDTWRGAKIGTVTIRDIVNGPLKATLPFPDDNVGLTCATVPVTDRYGNAIGNAVQLYTSVDDATPIDPDGITEDACVVVNVYAVSDAGGLVVIPVRKADVLRERRR